MPRKPKKPIEDEYSSMDAEALLAALVDRVDRGWIRLGKPRYAVLQEKAAFELSFHTREAGEVWTGGTIAELARDVLRCLEYPPTDPFRPRWQRLSRLQREVVENTLREHGARYMALAAASKLGHSSDAFAQFEIADAFHAALDELAFVDVDEHLRALPEEPLDAPNPAPGAASSSAGDAEARTAKERRAAVAKALSEVRAKNQERAKAGRAESAKGEADPKEPT